MSNQILQKVSFLKGYYLLFTFLSFFTNDWSIIFSDSLHASGFEKKIVLNGKVLNLDTSHPQEDFSSLTVGEQLELAPLLIDHMRFSPSVRGKNRIEDYLKSNTDPLLLLYSQIARVYFNYPMQSDRLTEFQNLYNTNKDFKSGALLRYHIALLKRQMNRDVSYRDLQAICYLPGEVDSCNLVKMIASLSMIESQGANFSLHLKVMELLKPYLTASDRNPPFYLETAYEIPDQLFRMGFSLEAGIIAGEMIRNHTDSRADALSVKIPFFLSTAGDFHGAVNLALKNSRFKLAGYKNYLIDWMLLGGEYDRAVLEINNADRGVLEAGFSNANNNYWMDLSPEITMQIKLALSLHLAGDTKKAIMALEILSESSEKNNYNEPVKYYARLRLAQILMKDNPDLSQKIAEDISYIAQENDWVVLEYYATVLDGWANYFRKQYFYSVVSFIKAAGILPPDKRSRVDDTLRLLGLLASYNKMNTGINQTGLVEKIHTAIRGKPYNEAISFIKYWSPVNIPRFFLEEASINLNARGNSLASLNYDLEFFREREYFFSPGKNPGGIRGFATTSYWYREISELPYVIFSNELSRGSRNSVSVAAGAYMNNYTGRLNAGDLDKNVLYVFPFQTESGVKIYSARYQNVRVTYIRKRRQLSRMVWMWNIRSIHMDEAELDEIRKKCERKDSLCLSGGASIRDIMNTAVAEVKILFHPELAIPFENLLSDKKVTISYFYNPYPSRKKSSALAWKQYAPSGCSFSSRFPGDVASIQMSQLFNGNLAVEGGVLFFPDALDVGRNISGKMRPAYLRGFLCGSERLRLWDLDRFSKINSPSLSVIFAESVDTEMSRVTARFITERGGSVLLLPSWSESDSSEFYSIVNANIRYGKNKSLKIAASRISARLNSSLRIISPSITD